MPKPAAVQSQPQSAAQSAKHEFLHYRVGTFRAAGLEACWHKTRRGKPIIVVRNPNSPYKHQRERWWIVDDRMFELMRQQGVAEGFADATILADIFSIPG